MALYKSYVFKTKDPAIYELRDLIEKDTGEKIHRKHLKAIHDGGGPTVSCMVGWFFGATERPQSPSLEAAGRAFGYKRVWVKQKPNRK